MENNGQLSPQEDAHFRENALEIINLVQFNEETFSQDEQKAIELANEALEFWITEGNVKRAYWETINSLNLIQNIIKSKEF